MREDVATEGYRFFNRHRRRRVMTLRSRMERTSRVLDGNDGFLRDDHQLPTTTSSASECPAPRLRGVVTRPGTIEVEGWSVSREFSIRGAASFRAGRALYRFRCVGWVDGCAGGRGSAKTDDLGEPLRRRDRAFQT